VTSAAAKLGASPLIAIRGLTKLYPMGDTVVRALDGVDLAIRQGEFIAITGASGSGKSTMMHLLGCLDRPTAGRYVLDGADVGRMSDRELAAVRNRKIGFVFQTFNLIQRTSAAENVAVPLFYARETRLRDRAINALERVGLGARYSHQPNELSGGERQRVAIARAIVNNPVLLMADEPTGNLDTRTGEQIMEIFHDLNSQGVTIVMVTHEHEVAMQAQRIVHMRDGKIISDRLTADIRAEMGISPSHADAPQPATAPAQVAPFDYAAPEPAATADPDTAGLDLPPQMAPGVNAGFWCSFVGLLLLLTTVGIQIGLQIAYAEKLAEIQAAAQAGQQVMPPVTVIALGLATVALTLASVVLSVIGIVICTGARKRARAKVGNWIGLRKARVGQVIGWISVGVPLAGIAYSLIQLVIKVNSQV
jgi:putative ABC transport system ATP-binding protein